MNYIGRYRFRIKAKSKKEDYAYGSKAMGNQVRYSFFEKYRADDPLNPPPFQGCMRTLPYNYIVGNQTHVLVDCVCDYTKCVRHLGNKCCGDFQSNQDVPEEFLCAISSDIMHEPVQLVSGASSGVYDRDSLQEHLSHRETDPMTNEELPNLRMRTDTRLLNRIKRWKKANLIVKVWGNAGE